VLPPGTYALQVRVETPEPSGELKLDLSIVEMSGQTFDWERLAGEGTPAGADPDDWRARVTLARGRIGESLDEVMAVLREAVSRSGEETRAFYDFDELLVYIVALYGTNGEEFSGSGAATPAAPRSALRSAASRDSQAANDSDSVQLITIAESPNPTETFVLTHGLGGLRGYDGRRTDFFEAAAALQRAHPNANVYIMDWTPGAKQFIPLTNGSIPDPFMAAANVEPASEAAFKLLRSKQLAGFFDPAKATLIGESLGNSVNGRTAQAFEESGLGKVNRALLLNPASLLGVDPFFRTSFHQSVAVSSSSFFDHKLKILADFNLHLQTSTLNAIHQHTSGIPLLRDHPELVRIFDDPRLQRSLVPFLSDGFIQLDAFYDPTPVSFSAGAPLLSDLFLARVLQKTLSIAVVNSHDPNDKAGPLGAGDARYIAGGEPLRYMISIENVAAATAAARDVVITDQLDAENVDLGSFSLGPISFGSHLLVPPPGLSRYTATADLRPENDLMVKVDARLNEETGLVTWKFTSLDPASGLPTDDPLAGFLPPNIHPPDGEGSVFFTAMPKPSLLTGSELSNRASIVFDSNAAIQTPVWRNTLDISAPASEVREVAAAPCSASLNVQWSGTDAGSGIRSYTVHVSDNGGPFTVWQSDTAATSATYAGQLGHTYAFYSVAQDAVGNVESPPLGPDATITPASPAQAPNIKLTGESIELWPANHRYNSVKLSQLVAGASDSCGGDVTADVVIAQVSSDEPEDARRGGDGRTRKDIVIAPDCKSVRLRAERQGRGNGRVYTISFKVTDAAGNTASATAKVSVRRSRKGKPAVDDGPSYTVAGRCL
jgi:hypothetical protein